MALVSSGPSGKNRGILPSTARGKRNLPGALPPDHKERVLRIFVSLFNPLVTWFTTLLLLFWCRRLFPGGIEWIVLPATYLLATIAWPYSKPFYTEALAAFFLVLAAWTSWLAGMNRHENIPDEDPTLSGSSWRSIACLACVGLFTGMAVLARLDSVVACPGLALIAIGGLLASPTRRSPLLLLVACGVGMLTFSSTVSFQLLLNQWHFGSPFASGYSDQPEISLISQSCLLCGSTSFRPERGFSGIPRP